MQSASKVALVASALLAAGIGAWLVFATPPSPPPSAPPSSPVAGKAPRVTRTVGSGSPETVVLEAESFELLPVSHQPAAVERAMADVPNWLRSHYPEADAEYLGTDCSSPPCMMGVRYEDDGMNDPEKLRAFIADYQSEIVRRAGWPMSAIEMSEDRAGRQYIWMYAVPQEFEPDEPLRQDLLDGGGRRIQSHMAPLVPEPITADVQTGE